MKSKSGTTVAQPELQELLQKPRSVSLLADNKQVTIIPYQGSKDKNRTVSPVDGESLDVVSSVIGNYGRWQLLMTFLLSLFSLPCTFHIYLPTFTATTTKFWCQKPDNLTALPMTNWINYSQSPDGDSCRVRQLTAEVTVENILNNTAPILDTFVKCTEWVYDRSEVGNTIISEWNLVCDRGYFTSLTESMFLIGVGLGGVVGGWISDKFGRKKILMGMMVAQCVLAILSLLVRSFIQYLIVRLIMGFASVSVVYAAFVLSVELVGGKWVTIAGVCNFFWLPLAYVIVSLLSLAMPNWRDLQLSLSVPGCLLLALWFVLPESPRWLISMGKTQEAKLILEKAAKFNGLELPADLDKLLMVYKTDTPDKGPSVTMLFKGNLRKRTICLFLSWYAMTIAYYGLLLNIGNFGTGNLHVTSIILAVVEIPAIAISIPILLKAGRRIPIFITMLVCGLACVASELFAMSFNDDRIKIACLMIGKFAIGSTNMMLPIYTVELYPTVVRNLGVGASQIAAGLALACIPYLWKLTMVNEYLPMMTIAALAAIGGAIVLLLPDTTQPEEAPAVLENKKTKCESGRNGTFTLTDDRGH